MKAQALSWRNANQFGKADNCMHNMVIPVSAGCGDISKMGNQKIKIPGDNSERISIYVRMARVLKDKIRRGDWVVGQMLPSLSDLCEQFDVSRNSMRQALQILSDEGLIVNGRGRQSVVKAKPATAADYPELIAAINNMETAPTSIDILETQTVGQPPEYLAKDYGLYESYLYVKKVHRVRKQPYVVASFYVASTVADTFDGLNKVKIDFLLQHQNKVRLTCKRQTISVGHADSEIAKELGCTIAEMVIVVRRWWEGPNGRLVCTSDSHYLAKYFVFNTVENYASRSKAKKIAH